MRNVKLLLLLLSPLLLGSLSTAAFANNRVYLIRTPVSIAKARNFCFQQQGQADTYGILFRFSGLASGTTVVDGTLLDSFPPTEARGINRSGHFKSGLHHITLTLDKEATLTQAYIVATSTSGPVNLLPVLSCSSTKNVPLASAESSENSPSIAEIAKKLNDLEARVNKLELLVEGKQESKEQVGTAKPKGNETLDQKLARLQKEATAMSNLGTALLKNADEWKKEVNALRASSK